MAETERVVDEVWLVKSAKGGERGVAGAAVVKGEVVEEMQRGGGEAEEQVVWI